MESKALYPIELAGTMNNPIFSQNIAELWSVATFIKRNKGIANLSLLLHFLAMLVGALSFVIPLCWQIAVSLRTDRSPEPQTPRRELATDAKAGTPSKKRKGSRPKNVRNQSAKIAEPAISDTEPCRSGGSVFFDSCCLRPLAG